MNLRAPFVKSLRGAFSAPLFQIVPTQNMWCGFIDSRRDRVGIIIEKYNRTS